jgi:hypothetical protein
MRVRAKPDRRFWRLLDESAIDLDCVDAEFAQAPNDEKPAPNRRSPPAAEVVEGATKCEASSRLWMTASGDLDDQPAGELRFPARPARGGQPLRRQRSRRTLARGARRSRPASEDEPSVPVDQPDEAEPLDSPMKSFAS